MTAKIWLRVCKAVGLGAIALLISVPLACDDTASDDDDDDDGTSSSSGGNGQTECGNCTGSTNMCQAGQYCEDAILCICTEGCLSNTNCASDQVCNTAAGYWENVGSG